MRRVPMRAYIQASFSLAVFDRSSLLCHASILPRFINISDIPHSNPVNDEGFLQLVSGVMMGFLGDFS